MGVKALVVFFFFICLLLLFAGAAIGEADLTPDTTREPPVGGNSPRGGSEPSSGRQGGGNSLCGSPYIVRSGDTLSAIARRCGVTLDQLVDFNPQIRNIHLIHVNDEIYIPPTSALPQSRQDAQEAGARGETAVPPEELSGAGSGNASGTRKSAPRSTSVALPAGLQPGAQVEVSVAGFLTGTPVEIAIGEVGQAPAQVFDAVTGANGEVVATVTIPQEAKAGQQWTVTVTSRSGPAVQVTAVPFEIEP